jgi:hypothetical protein
LLDFEVAFGILLLFQLKFQVRQDAEQRIIDFVRGAEGELRERGILLVFRELRLELDFVFIELTFLVKAPEKFFLGEVAFAFSVFGEFLGLAEFFVELIDALPLQAKEKKGDDKEGCESREHAYDTARHHSHGKHTRIFATPNVAPEVQVHLLRGWKKEGNKGSDASHGWTWSGARWWLERWPIRLRTERFKKARVGEST